jgi:hypothetical protein
MLVREGSLDIADDLGMTAAHWAALEVRMIQSPNEIKFKRGLR